MKTGKKTDSSMEPVDLGLSYNLVITGELTISVQQIGEKAYTLEISKLIIEVVGTNEVGTTSVFGYRSRRFNLLNWRQNKNSHGFSMLNEAY